MSFPCYESYKGSGVEWLGEVPEHWDVRAIKHIVSIPITDGPHETPNFPDEGIPFVSAEAVSTGVIDFSKIRGFISESDHFRYSQKYLPQVGDIYMVKSGATTGITAIVEVDREFNIWSPLAAIRCGKWAMPRFISNFMRSKNFQEAVTLNWSFGTQQNIGMGVIENLTVTLPPIPEQQSIAAFLDRETAKIDALIIEQQRLIELLKEKRQSVISHAVTKGLNPNAPMKDSGIEWLGEVPNHWEVRPIKFVIGKIDSGTSVNAIDEPAQNREIGVLKTSCVYSGIFNPAENKALIEQEIDRVTCPLKADTLIVSRMNTPDLVGATGLVTAAPINIYLPDRLWQVSFSDTCTAFIYFWTQTPVYRAYIKSVCAGTSSSMQNLSQDQFRSFILALPTFDEQFRIAEFLQNETTKLDTLTTEAKTAITLLQERRTALISAAVTGKIDVCGLVSAKTEVKAGSVPC